MSQLLKQETVYKVPGGGYENSKDRAIARHLIDILGKSAGDSDLLSFTAALELVKKRGAVIRYLQEMDAVAAAPPPKLWSE